MNVLYVGNFRPYFSTENELRKALESLGVNVHQSQEDTTDFAKLAAMARDVDADVVLWTRTWVGDHDAQWQALADLHAAAIPLVSYHLDRYVGLNRAHQLRDEPFFHGDLMVSADGGHEEEFAAAGVNHVWFPPGVSEFECALGTSRPKWRSDVTFVGSWQRYHDEWPWRRELVEWLQSTYRGRVKIWPRGRAVRGQDLRDLYASAKVVVGDSCLVDGSSHYWSDRVPETLGRGGFLLHPWVDGMQGHFTLGEHFDAYVVGDFEHLRRQIDGYLADADARARIASAGRAHVIEHHTYTVRMRQLLDLLVDRDLIDRPTLGLRKSVTFGRWSATFECRPDVDTDAEVVDEVWNANDYHLDTAGVHGTVIDVGANVGAFTVLAAKAGAHRVVAVEPNEANRERLAHHVKLNRIPPRRVEIMPLAVGRHSGERVGMVGKGGGSRVAMPVDRLRDSIPADVGTIALAELIERNAPVALLKVDIEGGEFDAFATLPLDALAHVERLVMEWHGPDMPHLSHLRGDEFAALVTKLADTGHVETHGHPRRGGLIYWRRY